MSTINCEHYNNVAAILQTLKAHHNVEYKKFRSLVFKEMEQFDFLKHIDSNGEEATNALIKFLYAKKNLNKTLATPGAIDKAWHILLLMPRFYATVCSVIATNGQHVEANFDHLIDHDPSSRSNAVFRESRVKVSLGYIGELFPLDALSWSMLWNENLCNLTAANIITVQSASSSSSVVAAVAPVVTDLENEHEHDDENDDDEEEGEEEEEEEEEDNDLGSSDNNDDDEDDDDDGTTVAEADKAVITTCYSRKRCHAVNNSNGKFKIVVKKLSGLSAEVYVKESTSIGHLKNILENVLNIPHDEQRLIYAGRQLQDGVTCGQCRIREDSVLHMVERLRGC